MEWEAQTAVSVVDIHLEKLLWVHYPGYAGVKGNDSAEQTNWRAKQPSQVACFSEDLKC